MTNKELIQKYQTELTILNQELYQQPFGQQYIHWQF